MMEVLRTLTLRSREVVVSENAEAVMSSMSCPSSCSMSKNFSQISVGRCRSGMRASCVLERAERAAAPAAWGPCRPAAAGCFDLIVGKGELTLRFPFG